MKKMFGNNEYRHWISLVREVYSDDNTSICHIPRLTMQLPSYQWEDDKKIYKKAFGTALVANLNICMYHVVKLIMLCKKPLKITLIC